MDIVYEHRMIKNVRLIPHTSSVAVDHSRTCVSTLGGNILFPIHVVNSQDELEDIITNFFKRTGYCTIEKFGDSMRRITDDHGPPPLLPDRIHRAAHPGKLPPQGQRGLKKCKRLAIR